MAKILEILVGLLEVFRFFRDIFKKSKGEKAVDAVSEVADAEKKFTESRGDIGDLDRP